MIFDTHTHLNVEEFAGREAEEIAWLLKWV